MSKTTIGQYAHDLQPKIWRPLDDSSERLHDNWFEWPPDLFALTSLLLGNTGAYRKVAVPPGGGWPTAGWSRVASKAASDWRRYLVGEQTFPAALGERRDDLEALLTQHVDVLYNSLDPADPKKNYEDNPRPWDLCRLLLELHAIADEAMRGIGTTFSPHGNLVHGEWRKPTRQQEPGDDDTGVSTSEGPGYAFLHLQANFLLALRGSLSRVPKYRAVVLPKTRTPQVGLSLRNLSLHLTCHQTEVDVAWRAFPWFNFEENTLNAMIVPWPYEIQANNFNPVPHPRTTEEIGAFRYFHYEPKLAEDLPVREIVGAIDKASSNQLRRVHLLIFPEMALRATDFRRLKLALETRLAPQHIPMIVAGVSAKFEDGDSGSGVGGSWPSPQTVRTSLASQGAAGYNRIVLSTYFAGKWFDVAQDKHHRWLVKQDQIRQYNLGGALAGGRDWWEAIDIPRRRLSILAANSWLTICPLICEDLARLEPVSDLIRGVGPTLVTAILMDGPQIRKRWPARYASVLADDPGSSVLTVTSLGMAKRSKSAKMLRAAGERQEHQNKQVIALWKDYLGDYIEIFTSENPDEDRSIVLNLSAEWTREFSADGRFETDNSAVFSYKGWYRPVEKKGPEAEADDSEQADSRAAKNESQDETPDSKNTRQADAKRTTLRILDMCELTLFTFYVDALLDSYSEPEELVEWLREALRIRSKEAPPPDADEEHDSTTGSLARLCRESIENRDSIPSDIPTPHLIRSIELANSLVKEVRTKSSNQNLSGHLESWQSITDVATQRLEYLKHLFDELTEPSEFYDRAQSAVDLWESIAHVNAERAPDCKGRDFARLEMGVPLTVLWSVHTRLATKRKFGRLKADEGLLMDRIERLVSPPPPQDPMKTVQTSYQKWRRQVAG